MKEREDIKLSNRVKILSALSLLREVLVADGEYGIEPDEFTIALNTLYEIEDRLFNEIDVTDK